MILGLLLGLLLEETATAADEGAFFRWVDEQEPPSPHPEVATGYRFSAELFAEIGSAIRENPGAVEVERMGTTVKKRPLWAFHISEPGVPTERSVLVFGGIHALEWIGTETATDALLDLIANPEPGVRTTVIPLLNPDGRAKVEADLTAGANVYRRGNGRNIDLNRDFGVNTEVRAIWSALLPAYYVHSKTPLSEPESQALDALAAREVYDRAVSLHAFGGFFYYPWAGRFRRPPDEADFVELGRAMERAQGAHAYKTRQLSHWAFFFRAQGTEIDHLYGRFGTRAFLMEITRSGLEPFHPSTWKSNFRLYNPADPKPHRERAVRAVRELIRHPTLAGELESPAGALLR